jgi:O-antigen/teichoic acid export membrane protein
MTFTIFFSVISVPYNASLSAHENMLWIAIVSVVEVVLKLGVALLVFWFEGDKLVFYSVIVAAVSVIVVFLYAVYCLKYYDEGTLNVGGRVDKPLMKELLRLLVGIFLEPLVALPEPKE